MSHKYYIDHPTKDGYEIEIPSLVRDQIIIDFLMNTYYWTVGIGCLIIGFLVGVLAR